MSNLSSLQFFQLLRWGTLFLISILFAKSSFSVEEIGRWETFNFLISAACFFWLSGLIQALLPLYGNSKTFGNRTNLEEQKSPELFSVSIVFFAFGVLSAIVLAVYFLFFSPTQTFAGVLIIYVLISSAAYLVEYVYLLHNRPDKIFIYGVLSFGVLFFSVAIPLFYHESLYVCILGFSAASLVRFTWFIVLLRKYAKFTISIDFIKEYLILAYPLIVSSLLSGSAEYFDGFLINHTFDSSAFAIFRYGAKEFPLVLLMANAFHGATLPLFKGETSEALKYIKLKSKRLIHLLFPITIFFLLFGKQIYLILFSKNFTDSVGIFNLFLLLIISRLVFPQTVLIGLKNTKAILWASLLELILHIVLSLILIKFMGIIGIALATVLSYYFEKIYLVAYNYFIYKIKPSDYIPLKLYLFYSLILTVVYFGVNIWHFFV